MHRLVLAVVLVSACGSVKEFAPISPGLAHMPVPNQQRIISEAATAAVTQAVANTELNLAQLTGKLAVVEVNGVFPASNHDLLDYLRTAVEAELIRRGVRVAHPEGVEVVTPEGGIAGRIMLAGADANKADARVVVSLDWGGVDYEDHKPAFGEHSFTLKARVHLTMRTLPVASGLRFASAVGKGESQIVIDADTSSGYTNYMLIPQKKE